jgi:hypothetical protein
MLGVRRPSVTVAAGLLQQAGLISYRRGLVTILDRERLEEFACEDYRLTREIYERMYRSPLEPTSRLCPVRWPVSSKADCWPGGCYRAVERRSSYAYRH